MDTSLVTNPTKSMLAFEIAQQPELWPTTVERVRAYPLPHSFEGLPVILTGAGTSAYAASSVANAWPQAAAIPTTDLLMQSPEEIAARTPSLSRGGLLISLARSGDSPESSAVVHKFQKHFPRVQHLAIVCNANGRLTKISGIEVIALDPRTNDQSLAMTGSFSNLVLAGLCLVRSREITEQLPAICATVHRALQESASTLQKIAAVCKDRIVFLTSNMQALAQEAVLKTIELTDGRVLAFSETFLSLRHGPVGILREDTPIVCFLSSDPKMRLYERDLMEDLRGKGLGRLIVVGDDRESKHAGEFFLPANAPSLPDALRTSFEITLAQLLAYHLSVKSGVDPDNPSPKGTITRVVRAFQIHEDVTTA